MKKNILFLCGGRSDEHEISLISTNYILKALDRNRFEPLIVGIAKDGRWFHEEESGFLVGEVRADKVRLNTDRPTVSLQPYSKNHRAALRAGDRELVFDAVFPVLHGPFGEDGTMQGLFDIVDVPYVGANCGASWICMDKELTKTLCTFHGIRNSPFVALRTKAELETKRAEIERLGLPVFVKPARQGSSVGVSKVSRWDKLEDAVLEAFCFDNKCLVEKAIDGREIECAVLGLRDGARASALGEIVPSAEAGFYSYDAKYISDKGAELVIPAKLSADEVARMQEFALQAFRVLECDGMARVDMFLEKTTGEIFLNEVNTIPGFTPISMYPKLWQVSGLGYSELITRLIELAFDRKGIER